MSADELVTVCDADGNVTGSERRGAVRAAGLWHATTSVLVRSGDGSRVYVHRRNDDKDVYPGMHDCWAGGVVAAGESAQQCAAREVAEELGVAPVELLPLFRFRFEQPPVRHHCHTFEVRWEGAVSWQVEEIAWGTWMTLAELRARLDDPGWPFVPDGRMAIEEWFRRHVEAT